MNPDKQRLLSYVPGPLLRSNYFGSEPPWSETLDGALLFADISGFTRLIEAAARKGPEGAEHLSNLLSSVFGRIAELAHSWNGDVIEYAGDAAIIVFESGDAGRAQAVLHAASCATALPQILESADGGAELTMRVGIGQGSMTSACVGDALHRQLYLLAGAPIDEATRAASIAAPGETALGPNAAYLAGDAISTSPLDPECVRLDSIVAPAPPERSDEKKGRTTDVTELSIHLPADIVHRVSSAGAQWLAEFRNASVLFVAFDELEDTSADFLPRLQDAVLIAKNEVFRFGGEILQLLADDKGTVLLAAWGLPGCTHEDDGGRALDAAVSIRTSLTQRGAAIRFGIARGRVFCGERGGGRRRDYAMLGRTVNLAARLMQKSDGAVLCDEATRSACRTTHSFDDGTPMHAKGFEKPIAVYRPTGKLQKGVQDTDGIVGREAEKQVLQDLISDTESRQAVLIEGEAGIGKSALLGHTIHRAREAGYRCLTGMADVSERSTPYYVWRAVLVEVLRTARAGETNPRDTLTKLLRDAPALERHSALLGGVLGLELPESNETRQLTTARRSELVRDLVVYLVQMVADDDPVIIALDDVHWMDSASWSLARAVHQRVDRLHVAMGSRPVDAPGSDDEAELRGALSLTRLRLEPLDVEDILQLSARQLEVEDLPPALVSFVRDKSGGNPFFAGELVAALHEDGHVEVADGRCRIATDLESLNVPATVQGVVAGRIDRLDVGTQFTMKVASVIGRVFENRTVIGIHPLAQHRAEIPAQLHDLVDRGLTQLESPEPELSYLFRHVITQQVTYELLSFAQRRTLHAAVALWYERENADVLSAYFPLLAQHWSRAGDSQRAMDYFQRAGKQAVIAYANREAIRFFDEAESLAQDDETEVSPIERGRWQWLAGRAYLQLADNANSRRHLLRSLELIGQPAPVSLPGRVPKLIMQMLRVMLGRPLALRRGVAPEEQRPVLVQAAGVHHDLGEIAYFDNDLLGLAYSAVRAINLAEATANPAVVARSYTTACVAVANGGFDSLALAYRARAIEAADRTDDLAARAYSYMGCALFHSGQGDWSVIDEMTAEGARLFEQIGDRYRWEMTTNQRAYGLLHQGKYEEARPLLEAALASASADDTLQVPIIAVSGLTMIDLAQGQVDADMLARLERLAVQADDMAQPSDCILANGVFALAALDRGDMDAARLAADRVDAKFKRTPPPSFYTYRSVAAMAEVALEDCGLARESANNLSVRTCDRLAATRIRKLEWFAKYFPIARPRLRRIAARLALLQSRTQRARAHLEESADLARKLGMPYEAALTEEVTSRTDP